MAPGGARSRHARGSARPGRPVRGPAGECSSTPRHHPAARRAGTAYPLGQTVPDGTRGRRHSVPIHRNLERA
ncbi:hypothetical protein [Ornithinimicrobium kibberense]|uniref:hypothetical protein n=1 Tax=Ornithinimicrobium kibberense TaxID=282060 RepID=UPI00361EF026